MSREYDNFDVTLTADGPVYHATFGDLTVTFSFPLEQHEIEPFLEMFGKARTRKGSPQLDRATAVGNRLFETIFNDDMQARWEAAEDQARLGGKGLRLRLDLSDAYDLVTLPWEYLYEAQTDSFVALSNWTPVVRHLDVHEPREPLPIDGPLQILVMISDPIERRGTLDVEREWQQLNEALAEALADGEIELTRLADGQLQTLQFELLENEYHVFHFIGHGEFDEVEDDGVLVLEDARGREVHVSGRSIGNHLRDAHTLRLVVLNNCEGAATSESDPFAGSAQSLLRKGIPAIVAMQFEITDRAAIDFARGFYRSLSTGLPVDAALAEARKTLSDGAATRVEFGAPVLYMASHDGNLFDRTEAALVAEPPVPPLIGADPTTSPTIDDTTTPPAVETKATKPPSPPKRPDDADGGFPMWAWVAIAVAALAVVVILILLFRPDGTDDGTSTTVAPTTTAAPTTTTAPTTTAPTTAALETVEVVGTEAWTPTQIQLTDGERFVVDAVGTIWHNDNIASETGPDGDPDVDTTRNNVIVPSSGEPLDAPHGALVGRIGIAGDPFFVGEHFDGIAAGSGRLYLGINDVGPGNNAGVFIATVEQP